MLGLLVRLGLLARLDLMAVSALPDLLALRVLLVPPVPPARLGQLVLLARLAL